MASNATVASGTLVVIAISYILGIFVATSFIYYVYDSLDFEDPLVEIYLREPGNNYRTKRLIPKWYHEPEPKSGDTKDWSYPQKLDRKEKEHDDIHLFLLAKKYEYATSSWSITRVN